MYVVSHARRSESSEGFQGGASGADAMMQDILAGLGGMGGGSAADTSASHSSPKLAASSAISGLDAFSMPLDLNLVVVDIC